MATDTLPKTDKNGKVREKVQLKPGFHLTDWLRLTQQSTIDLSGRNGKPLRHITIEELELHNTKFDCWTAYNEKVYNITNYLLYHPGGESKLLLGAGKDCTALYNKYHPWVNIETMLGKCLVGTLLSHGNRNMTSIVEEPSNLNDSSKDSLIKAKDLLVESLNELERDADALDQNINSLEINDNNS